MGLASTQHKPSKPRPDDKGGSFWPRKAGSARKSSLPPSSRAVGSTCSEPGPKRRDGAFRAPPRLKVSQVKGHLMLMKAMKHGIRGRGAVVRTNPRKRLLQYKNVSPFLSYSGRSVPTVTGLSSSMVTARPFEAISPRPQMFVLLPAPSRDRPLSPRTAPDLPLRHAGP